MYSVKTNRIIDDCIIDDTCDKDIYRDLEAEMDISVELTLRGALSMYERKGSDVAEVFSPVGLHRNRL